MRNTGSGVRDVLDGFQGYDLVDVYPQLSGFKLQPSVLLSLGFGFAILQVYATDLVGIISGFVPLIPLIHLQVDK